MIFAVLFSTVSFSVNTHYCGDIPVARSIFKAAENCGMEVQETSDSPECSLIKKHCCSDEKIVTQAQDELKIPINDLNLEQPFLAASFTCTYTYINLFNALKEHSVPYQGYPPPLLVQDIHILNQTFLI